MISVIVPVYNVEKYLEKCVESICNQTYQDLEIILIDDGATDNSGKICDELAKQDERIVVIHQKNAGQASARNAGLEIFKGDYLAFVDSDDTIEANMFEILLTIMEKPDCDIAICGHRIVRKNEIRNETFKESQEQVLDIDELWEEIFGKLNNAVWNKLYKRELIGDNRFPVDLIHGEDLIFNLNYLKKCIGGRVNRIPCYNYLKRENSVTTALFSEKKLMEISSKDRALEIVKQNKMSQIPNAQKYCFRARMNVMRAIFRAGVEKKYISIVEECREYVQENYTNVKRNLRKKEQIEYYMNTYWFCVYKMFVRKFW